MAKRFAIGWSLTAAAGLGTALSVVVEAAMVQERRLVQTLSLVVGLATGAFEVVWTKKEIKKS